MEEWDVERTAEDQAPESDLWIDDFEFDSFGEGALVGYTRKKRSPKEKEEKERQNMELYDWVQCVVTALVAGILIFVFVGRVVGIDGWSMYPTLFHGDKVITSNLFYTPQQGDVVVFQTDTYGDESLVKRIIATGGQTVDIDFISGIVYVDGVALEEDYTAELTYIQEDFDGPVSVPEGYIFVLGDNRNASLDSRNNRVGLVPESCIIGKAYLIIFPGKEEHESRDWSRLGSVYK